MKATSSPGSGGFDSLFKRSYDEFGSQRFTGIKFHTNPSKFAPGSHVTSLGVRLWGCPFVRNRASLNDLCGEITAFEGSCMVVVSLASELDDARVQMKEERPKFSESSLAYLAFALLIFTIFYNVLFITVIKPSIDGPEPIEEPVAATSVRKAS
ncbi:hypothetical protein CsSME_00047715 [Camellia sinensis var. sinensis]